MTHQLFFLWNGSMAKYTNNDAFPIRTSDFLKSLRERPGTTISRRIEITDLRDHNAGRETGSWPSSEPIDSILAEDSAVAVENVKEDEDLCFRWLWEVGCRVSYLFRAVPARAVLQLEPQDHSKEWNIPGTCLTIIYDPKRVMLTPNSWSEMDIQTINSTTSKYNRLNCQEQDARVILSGNAELFDFH